MSFGFTQRFLQQYAPQLSTPTKPDNRAVAGKLPITAYKFYNGADWAVIEKFLKDQE